MSSSNIQKRPNGKWRARYRDAAGQEHARHFDRKIDAQRFLAGVMADLERGTYIDPAAGRRTFGDYADAWLAAQVHRETTAALVESHLRRHVLPTFGPRRLASVRPSEVQAWVKQLSTTLAPATVELVYRYLAGIFRAAAADKLIPASPCTGVRLPKRERHLVEPLSTDSVEALVAAVPGRYKALAVLAAGTGLRQGEALGLTLDRVDFLRRTLRVDRQLQTLRGEPRLAPPKTEASRRTIPLPNVVLDALAQHVAAYPPGRTA